MSLVDGRGAGRRRGFFGRGGFLPPGGTWSRPVATVGGRRCVFDGDDQASLPHFQCLLDRFGQAGPRLAGHEAVDHDFDVVPHLAVQMQLVVERDDPAVDPGPGKSLFEQIDEQIAVFPLLSPNQGGQHDKPRVRRKGADAFDDLFARLGRNRPGAFRTMPLARAA